MRVRVFGQLLDVFMIVAADVDVEKHHVAVDVLLADEIFKVFLAGNECLRQAGLFVPRIEREVEDGSAGIAEAIGDLGTQQAPVGSDIDPEALLGRIVDNFVRDLRTQQGLAAHEREHAATMIMEPIDRALGDMTSSVMPFTLLLKAQQYQQSRLHL